MNSASADLGQRCTLHAYTAYGEDGNTLHVHTYDGVDGYTLHVHTASGGEGYTLHVYTGRGGEGYTLHVYTARGGEGYIPCTSAHPYYMRRKGIHPHVQTERLMVEKKTLSWPHC